MVFLETRAGKRSRSQHSYKKASAIYKLRSLLSISGHRFTVIPAFPAGESSGGKVKGGAKIDCE
jgi:hypothetical protein